jgi:hypothetical protein
VYGTVFEFNFRSFRSIDQAFFTASVASVGEIFGNAPPAVLKTMRGSLASREKLTRQPERKLRQCRSQHS